MSRREMQKGFLKTLLFISFIFLLLSPFKSQAERMKDDQILREQIKTLTQLNSESVRQELSNALQNNFADLVPAFGPINTQDFKLTSKLDWYPAAYGFTRFQKIAEIEWGHVTIQNQKILVVKISPHRPNGKLAIFSHGYLDHMGCYSNFFEELVLQGATVISYDLPGHGLSSGAPGSIDDFESYAQVLAHIVGKFNVGFEELILIGFSTGASAILEAQRLKLISPKVRRIFISPLIRVAFFWLIEPVFKAAYFARTSWNWSVLDFAVSPRRWINSNSHDELFLEFLQKDVLSPLTVPGVWTNAYITFADRNKVWLESLSESDKQNYGDTLLLQGTGDRVVDGSTNISFLQWHFPNTQTVWFDGGGHHLLNESLIWGEDLLPKVYGSISQFIHKN